MAINPKNPAPGKPEVWGDNALAAFMADTFTPAYAKYCSAEGEADGQEDTAIRTRLSAQVELGKVLYELGLHLPHGAWGPWCAKNLPHYSLTHCDKMKGYGKAEKAEPGAAQRMMEERAETDRLRRIAVIEAAVKMNGIKFTPPAAEGAPIPNLAELKAQHAEQMSDLTATAPIPAGVEYGQEAPANLIDMPDNPAPALTSPATGDTGVAPTAQREETDLKHAFEKLSPAHALALLRTFGSFSPDEALAMRGFRGFQLALVLTGWKFDADGAKQDTAVCDAFINAFQRIETAAALKEPAAA